MKVSNNIIIRPTQPEIDAGFLIGLPPGTVVVLPSNVVQIIDSTGVPQAIQTAGNSPLNNFAATTAPTSANDNTQGYRVGSLWVNTTANESYVCTNSGTGVADWELTTANTIAEINTLSSVLAGKEPSITAGTASQYFRGDKTFQTLDKTAVGLANVDNTSDLNKPLSTADQTALAAKQDTLVSGTNIKTVNGVSLLGAGDVPSTTTITNTSVPTLTAISTVITANTALVNANWGNQYAVDATAGNVVIVLPTAVGFSGSSLKFVRLDNTANTVTVQSFAGQIISGIQANAVAINIKPTGYVTVRSDGTNPVLLSWELPLSVNRLWLPTDAVAGSPVVWHDILTGITLVGSAITGVPNRGSLGTGYNLAAVGASRPTLVGTQGVAGSYASFNGSNVMASAAAQPIFSSVNTITIAAFYQQPTQATATLFGQDNASVQRIQTHPKWTDGNTYVDFGDAATQRMFANIGTVAAGTAVNHAFVGVRNAANGNAYYDGNPTASITSTTLSGTPTGTQVFRWSGDNGGNNLPSGSRIYETIGYAVALSTADVARLAAYFAHRHLNPAILNSSNAYTIAPPVFPIATY